MSWSKLVVTFAACMLHGVTVKSWYLYRVGLVRLPDEMCDLTITGDLNLYGNLITSASRASCILDIVAGMLQTAASCPY